MSSVSFQLAFLNLQLLVRGAAQHMGHAYAILINVEFVWPAMYSNQIKFDLLLLKLFFFLLRKAAGAVQNASNL